MNETDNTNLYSNISLSLSLSLYIYIYIYIYIYSLIYEEFSYIVKITIIQGVWILQAFDSKLWLQIINVLPLKTFCNERD